MAFKPAFYHELPPKVCKLADERNFPIFRIDDYAITFRDIICDISDAIRASKDNEEVSIYLSRMMHENLGIEDISDIAAKISPYFRGNARISLLFPQSNDAASQLNVGYIIRRLRQSEEFKGKVILSGIEICGNNGLAIIVTSDAEKPKIFDIIEKNAISTCGINLNGFRHLTGNIHPTFTALNRCITEAQYAYIASLVMDRTSMDYRQLADLAFLIPTVNNPHVRTFMQAYLHPILFNEESIPTAVAVVRAGGDYARAAEKLCVHKNTVRYRMSKIKDMLSPEDSENDFYMKLSLAIKIYLIIQVQT